MTQLNHTVLMTDTRYFADDLAINPYMDANVVINQSVAQKEHAAVKAALEQAGITVRQTPSPEGCQDGVYTANWGLSRGDTVILSSLPDARKGEEKHAEAVLQQLGKQTIKAPFRFSGQGDALPCGNLVFVGSQYRTDPQMHDFIAQTLGYQVIGLQTVPKLDESGQPLINQVSGWPDSFFYDIDLALAVLTPYLIAWCPDAFLPASQEKIRSLGIDKIEVSLDEAIKGFACNLVSSGSTVIMSAHAPKLQKAIENKGLTIITPEIEELAKGGGYIRCMTLTLDND